MTRFTASNQSAATLKSSRKDVWVALTDAELLPELTPYLNRIDVEGDRWTWHVAKVPILGKSIGSTFTEVMTFDEPSRIDFVHDPARTDEKAGVDGRYVLKEARQGTDLSIELAITVELMSARRLLASGAFNAAATAWWIATIVSFGVFAGTNRPFQRLNSYFG